MSEFDEKELDPGIRELVVWLREIGIPTTDSGDGVSKPDMECAINEPHVFAVYEPNGGDPFKTLSKASMASLLLSSMLPRREGTRIEVSWSPRDERAIVALFGYTNEDVPTWRTVLD